MADTATALVSLDQDQVDVVQVEASSRQIVLAGPGTGKTQVVAALLEHLTQDEGLSATDEVLVISFSRGAVAAIRERTVRTESPRITVRTLDALAARLLDELDTSDDWRLLGFDQRVARAVERLQGDESEELQMLRHLVVDEVQDVVGVRAELLLAVIDALPDDAGFTLLGDPMQAVYDFQLNERHTTTSGQMLACIRGAGGVSERRLHGQYRARSNEAARVLGLGLELAPLATAQQQARVLDAELARLLIVDPLERLAPVVDRWTGSTAVLCRTNGEALLLADELRVAGLAVHLQRSAQDPAVTSDVARLLATGPSGTISRACLLEKAAALQLSDPGRTVLLLSDLVSRRGSDVDVLSVARRIANGPVPVELQQTTDARVVVSTIHRAKGLEFDNVVLVGASAWLAASEELEEAVRVAFVAMTRTRDRLVTAASPDTRGLRLDKRSGRWIRGGPAPWMTFGFELQGADTRSPNPVGDDAVEIQDYLDNHVSAGDDVDLQLDPLRSTLDLPMYSISHGGRRVGRTTQDFGERLVRRIRPAKGRKGKPWPELSGAVVESVETVGGLPQPVETYGGAGRWGLWLSVRLTGLVKLSW